MAENALTRLSLAAQIGVALFIAALIGGGFYYFWYADALQQEATKSQKLAALRQEISRLEVIAAKLEEFQREVRDLEAKLDILKKILPPAKETPDLMRRIQYLATQSNLTIRRFSPGATVNKQFPGTPQGGDSYQEWPINVDVEGTYHNLAFFFERVGRLPRLVNVGNLKVRSQAAPKPSNTIAASCVATTFVYVEAPPAPAGAVAPK